ncbi:aminotransferase class V-fold PLP-dependent enzyme [Bacillus mangrovi]|uniref:Aminotransferase class V-fold PLP-dependent enzyme n=1 Tax=Metabacillus mangrovi TaxID=1491830 RepID=A0A7X2V4A6_9BACI|nr:cysteine desulfurase family protein [Metabacillus mangrovi]MTH52828.1 aminotransferase class V-fold PLP-dependent enzyme [Metabacillus mangrovi]
MLYLDNSATTVPYPEVLDSYMEISREYFGNPSSLNQIGSEAELLLRKARRLTAGLLGAEEEEIIFTSGGTEANNLAIKGTALKNRHKGRHIITSAMEHPSVMEACLQLEKEFGFQVTVIKPDRHGRICADQVGKEVRSDTILVTIMHVNNEVGTIQPVEEIGMILKNHPNVIFHTDHVQGAVKVPLDLKRSGIDLCSFSPHKFHGLKGTGILYARKGIQLMPLLSGGEQERASRSGTENVAGIAAGAKALRLAMDQYKHKLSGLYETKSKLISRLEKIEGITVNTPLEKSAPHIIHFSVPGIKSEVLVHKLQESGICVSTTSACSSKNSEPSHTLLAMGRSRDEAMSGIRISLNADIDFSMLEPLFPALEKGILHIKRVKR